MLADATRDRVALQSLRDLTGDTHPENHVLKAHRFQEVGSLLEFAHESVLVRSNADFSRVI